MWRTPDTKIAYLICTSGEEFIMFLLHATLFFIAPISKVGTYHQSSQCYLIGCAVNTFVTA